MKKRLLALLLVVCIVATLVPTAFATGYSDVDGHWAEDAIARWSAYGIVEGNNGKFEPGEELTRGQLAAIIARLLKLPAAESAGFKDTDGHWAEDVINRCAAAGIMLGDGVNARPGDAVSREETMVLLARALGIKPVENVDMSDYKDAKKVSSWAEGYVAAMTDKGIVNGIDGSLQPASDINRASAMTILHNAISTYANQDGQVVSGTGDGIVLVAAKNVTVTGEADGIVVSAGAEGGTTNITAAKADSVTVQAADADVNINSSEVKDVAVEAPQAEVTLTNTKTENVEVSEKAEDAKVEVGTGSTVTNVENKADGTTVSGSGTVSNVTTSGDNTKVETGGTKVEAAPGTTGTTAGNQTVVGGGTATTTPTTPAPSVHYHSYTYKANGDGTHTGTCACTGTVTEACADGTDTDTKCDKCADDTAAYEASVSGKKYKTLAEAVAVGGEITLLKDAVLTEQLVVTKNITLDLNGNSIINTSDIWDDSESVKAWSLISAQGGNLTITGNGAVKAKANDCYAVDVRNGATVTIEGGTYTGNIAAVYVYEGTLNVEGGVFNIQQKSEYSDCRYTLNCYDAAYAGGTAKIVVTGGKFGDFNPADNLAESGGANFVAPGYISTEEDGNYTVSDARVKIGTAAELKAFAEEVNKGEHKGKVVVLTANIDLEGKEWTPIGTSTNQFVGTFDGQGYTISNLKITSGDFAGLFGYVSTATIKNVKLANADVSGGERMASLIGKITANATVTNCSNDADSSVIGSGSNTGGLIGEIVIGTVELSNLVNNAAVENTKASSSRAGGIVAQVTQENNIGATVTMTGCVNNGAVKTNNGYAGGIVSAYQQGTLTFDNCVNNGELTGLYEGNMLGWYTSIRSITISSDTNEFDINAIGCIDIAISSDMSLYGKHYFVNRKADLTGVDTTKQIFSEIFAEGEIGTSPKALWDKLIAFYAFAAETNVNFAGYPDTYWRMFNQLTGYSEPDWNTYFNGYNAKCEAEGRTADKLTKEEFNHATWREHIVYLAPQV